ncbi:hypothetical protein [Lysinibacillus xylanilyticus]|uniref:hypothetical protein n=1 Tax=Lysinibacillus xylanilyticus TaxID=582475 RepID=UPI0036DC4F14
MLNWEIKKILKDKSSIVALILMIVSLLIIIVFKPSLETQNEYLDESNNKTVIDNRSEDVIANEKLAIKREMIKSTIADPPDSDKTLKSISKEKLNLDNGNKYENVDFYKVFTERIDFSLSIIIMMIIIVMLIANLYTDEIVANVSPIILSSKQKNKALYSKVIIAILLPILVYSVYLGATWIITYMQFGKPLNGDLQAYRIIDMAVAAKLMTINQYALAKIITTTLMLLGVSVVSLLVSFLSNNSVKSISISTGFIAAGRVLAEFSFLPQQMLLLLGGGNYISVINGESKISGFYNGQIDILSKTVDMSNLIISIYALIVIIGLLGCIYTIKKVLTK